MAFQFGNGVNGAVPPLGTTIRADYAATAGQAGNLLAQTGWSVGGVSVRFANVDPLAGGEDGDTLDDLRHTARVRSPISVRWSPTQIYRAHWRHPACVARAG